MTLTRDSLLEFGREESGAAVREVFRIVTTSREQLIIEALERALVQVEHHLLTCEVANRTFPTWTPITNDDLVDALRLRQTLRQQLGHWRGQR